MALLCRLPKAPPETLLLADNNFHAFHMDPRNLQPSITCLTGDRLSLRERGTALRDDFVLHTLEPSVEELLHADLWADWVENLDVRAFEPEQEAEFLRLHRTWKDHIETRSEDGVEEGLVPVA